MERQVAIITGGSRGIGAAVAERLARMGFDLAIIYASNQAAAVQVCEKCSAQYHVQAEAYQCDVSDFAGVKETVADIKKTFGTVHVLVNCAGITKDRLLGFMSEDDFDAVIDTNLKGTFNMIRHCCGMFIRHKAGCIVNVSSVVGLSGNAGQANYAASKAGVIGLTKSVAKELAGKNIRCNAVAPGLIDTDMTKDLSDMKTHWLQQIPLGRAGQAEEVADAVAFLVGAEYVTGEVLRVDGGMAM